MITGAARRGVAPLYCMVVAVAAACGSDSAPASAPHPRLRSA